MLVMNSSQIRKAEEAAVERGASFEDMMLKAGRNAAKEILNTYKTRQSAVIVCGKGKNGGDGFVIADSVRREFEKVTVILPLGEPTDELAQKMFLKLQCRKNINIINLKDTDPDSLISVRNEIQEAGVIVDAVFGIGFSGKIEGVLAELINEINASPAPIVAIDIPSGLLSDSGCLTDLCVKADLTLTMYALKPVHVLKPAADECGFTRIIDIGIGEPDESTAEFAFKTATPLEVASKFKKRPHDCHKGTFGTVLIVAGSYEMPGAAVLSAKAATSLGAGLVISAFPDKAYPAIASKLTEQVLLPLPSNENGRISAAAEEKLLTALKRADALLIGPGLGVDFDTETIVNKLLLSAEIPIVLDADGINVISKNIDILKEVKAPLVLTPHPGEMSRLCNADICSIVSDKSLTSKYFTDDYTPTLVLKGSNTVIAERGRPQYINSTGSPSLARAGSGDLLSGMTAALAAGGMDTFEAAVCAVYIHGMAGDNSGLHFSETAANTELTLSCLPLLLSRFLCKVGADVDKENYKRLFNPFDYMDAVCLQKRRYEERKKALR